jgi:uncharacterized membrane protein
LLWAILSVLFAVGFAVSATMVGSERNAALDSVAERGREEAQLATASLTGKQLSKPITGSSYDKLAEKIWKSVSSDGSISGVTIWSSKGRILFSLNESLVGSTPVEMRSLITGAANGSGSTRVVAGTVQTFTPVSKAAIVQVDQPFAAVEAQTGDLWSMLRLGSAVGLAVSLLLLGLTFISAKDLVRAAVDAQPAPLDEMQGGDQGEETKAQGRQPEGQPPTETRVPTYGELFGLESEFHAEVPARVPEEGERPGDEQAVLEAEEQPSAEEQLPAEQLPAERLPAHQPPTEKRVPTYAEVFSVESDLDAGIPAHVPEDEERPGDERAVLEAEEQLPAEERAPASEEDVQPLHADLDQAMDQVEALDADGESEEPIGTQWPEEFRDVFQDMARGGDAQTQEMRQRREEFKNRAKQAELRLKKQDAELHEAPSAPSSER